MFSFPHSAPRCAEGFLKSSHTHCVVLSSPFWRGAVFAFKSSTWFSFCGYCRGQAMTGDQCMPDRGQIDLTSLPLSRSLSLFLSFFLSRSLLFVFFLLMLIPFRVTGSEMRLMCCMCMNQLDLCLSLSVSLFVSPSLSLSLSLSLCLSVSSHLSLPPSSTPWPETAVDRLDWTICHRAGMVKIKNKRGWSEEDKWMPSDGVPERIITETG